jgi:hypothetical protein
MKRTRPTSAEIENAVAVMFAGVELRAEYALCSGEISRCRKWRPGHRMKVKLGTKAIATFRAETGAVGKIDWEAFRAWWKKWLDDHASAINFSRLIVSLITLLILI